ncbi:MAG: pantoate--beta-alanine ligase [Bacteroidales bacterium]|jgi:pantoate--beta-alanine ligase|nr:pantoate--beta-alanine ligase [Bacteroidales bacterium]
MILCRTKTELQDALKAQGANPIIGFVPTMGALHEGHLSLVRQARRENEVVVVSVFVNPIQFNNSEDLEKYPKDLECDLDLLKDVGSTIVFAPENAEMYPENPTEVYNFGTLETVMEGAFRPGHFNGVAVVVKRLFDLVKPTTAYFGEKDFQQLAIIRALVEQENLAVEIVGCPTVREHDGLAMSSRNTQLSEEDRRIAPQIHKILRDCRDLMDVFTPAQLKEFAEDQLQKIPRTKLEYFEIVNAKTLQPIEKWKDCRRRVACVAIWLGDVRLIDNVKI